MFLNGLYLPNKDLGRWHTRAGFTRVDELLWEKQGLVGSGQVQGQCWRGLLVALQWVCLTGPQGAQFHRQGPVQALIAI